MAIVIEQSPVEDVRSPQGLYKLASADLVHLPKQFIVGLVGLHFVNIAGLSNRLLILQIPVEQRGRQWGLSWENPE